MPNIVRVVPLSESGTESLENKPQTAWMERRGLKQALYPILWCLKATGLLHGISLRESAQLDVDDDSQRVNSRFFRCSPSLTYCIFVVVVLWGNFANTLTAFKGASSFDGRVINQVITATWFFQVACFALNNVIGCRRWNDVFYQWDELSRRLDLQNNKMARRCAVLGSIFYVMWEILSNSFISIGALFISGQSQMFTSGNVGGITVWVAFLICYFFFSSAWYLVTASFAIVCIIMYSAFRKFTLKFNNAISADGRFEGDIEEYRLQHEELKQLLYAADSIFSMYILVAIGTIIPLIIFTLYFVLFETVDLYSYVATWWSVSLSLIQITVVFVGGGIVNHYLAVFLSQLTSGPIGFSAFGLFVIDKPTIITFAGSIVTYAVVVIQFKPTSTSGSSLLQSNTVNITM